MRWKSILCTAAAMLPLHVQLMAQESQVQTDTGFIKVTPLVHSSVQIEYTGIVLQVDPWSVIDLEDALLADIILVSDDAGHHLDHRAEELISPMEEY